MHLQAPSPSPFRLFVALAGIMLSATAVLMIKASTLPPGLLAACRLLGAAVVIVPLWWWETRGQGRRWASLLPSVLPGVFLGLHFIGWNLGARATLVGNATLVVNMVPLVMPFLAWALLREHPTTREILGTTIAVLGLVVLGLADYHFSPENLVGDGLCFVAMLLYAFYILMARKRSKPGALFTYLFPLYLTGGLVCLAWAWVAELPIPPVSALDGLLAVGLVLGPTVAGHTIANWAMTVMRAQVFSLLNLSQFVFAGFFAFLLFREVPGPAFYFTAVLVVTGAVVALIPRKAGAGLK